MKNKDKIVKILQYKIRKIGCDNCLNKIKGKKNYPCNICAYHSRWILSEEESLKIVEKILKYID